MAIRFRTARYRLAGKIIRMQHEALARTKIFLHNSEFDLGGRLTGALSREAKLLAECGAVCAVERSSESVSVLAAKGIDWNLLQRMAAGHGMSAMVWRMLSNHPTHAPHDVLEALRSRHLIVSARSLYLVNELIRVCELLAKSGLTAIAFKGPTLAALAYREPGLREFSDLDLLVPFSEFPAARQALIAHGYRPRCADARPLTSAVFQCYEDIFTASDAVALLDVHWRALPRHFDFADPALLQTRTQRIELNGRPLATLATEDLILFLCIHGAKHGWPLLSWICDLAGLIHRGVGIDWAALLFRAEASQCRRALLLGLKLAHELIGVAIPSEFLAAMSTDPVINRLAGRVVHAMFLNFGDRVGLSQELIIPLLSIETAARRMRYLADRTIWPTLEDWEAMPLPAPLFPLYFLTRPFRLAFAKARRSLVG